MEHALLAEYGICLHSTAQDLEQDRRAGDAYLAERAEALFLQP